MALKNLFDMVKADRYTADGREAIIKAQEAETEDATRRTYQIGEISQATGLQKTANGWVKPKSGKQPGAKKEEPKNVHGAEVDKIYERQLKRIKELKAKGFTDEQIDNDKIIKQTKEDMRNVGKKPESKSAAGPSRADKEAAIREELGLRGENDLDRFSDEQIEKMYQKTQQTPEQKKADFDKSKIGQAMNKYRAERDRHESDYKASQRMRDAEKEIDIAESLERMYSSRGMDNEAAAAREYRNAAETFKALNGQVANLPRNQMPDAELQQKVEAAKIKLNEARVKARPGMAESKPAAENRRRGEQLAKPAAAPKLNQVEKVDNTNRPYRIKGTQFYFETPEEAETAIVAGTRGEGKTYAKPSSDPTINEIQNALGFKLDSEYAGKYSMDDFIKKTGKDEYGVRVWSFGTNSKGTLIDTIVEGYNKPDATIKKENGEWRLHYTDRDGKKMIVTPKGREWPTSDAAPRVLTGDTRIRVRKA